MLHILYENMPEIHGWKSFKLLCCFCCYVFPLVFLLFELSSTSNHDFFFVVLLLEHIAKVSYRFVWPFFLLADFYFGLYIYVWPCVRVFACIYLSICVCENVKTKTSFASAIKWLHFAYEECIVLDSFADTKRTV